MMIKKATLVIITLLVCVSTSHAQPAGVKNVAKSIFSLSTYRADGSLLATSHGVFIGNSGEAVSDLKPFIGAAKAVVTNQKGDKMNVVRILGINDIYDMARFTVDGKTTPATIAQSTASPETKVWLVEYGMKNPHVTEASVKSVETFMEKYNYYIFAMNAPDNATSCPFVNANGEIIGLLQMSKTSYNTYATDARYAGSLAISGLSYSDANIRQIGIPVAMPDDKSQAQLLLMMASQSNDSLKFESAINDFLDKFPTLIDGYDAKARRYVDRLLFDEADKTMSNAIKNAENKDEAHYNYGKLIYDKLIYNSAAYDKWTLEKAEEEIQQAYSINPLPHYRNMIGQIEFSKKDYNKAYDIFMQLHGDKQYSNPELLFNAARCKEMMQAPHKEIIALLDSAINTTDTLRIRDAAPYFLERANIYMQADCFRQAVFDYTRYEYLMQGRVSATFYYLREQAEVKGRLYQQALVDIARAIILEPKEPSYYAEMASLQIRLNMTDKAEETAQRCVEIAPDYPDGLLVLGLAQVKNGKKEEGLKNMQKAKDLGNAQADSLIEKYSK